MWVTPSRLQGIPGLAISGPRTYHGDAWPDNWGDADWVQAALEMDVWREMTHMKHRANLFLILNIAALCRANEPSPYFREFARLDRIFALTGSHSQTGAMALELLQLVALGRTSAVPAGAETKVGLAPGELQQAIFAEASVRVYALQRIGECDLPEALEFLKNLKRVDLGEDTTQMIWPNSRVALTNALLHRIRDPEARTEFLVNALKQGEGRGLVVHWASQQLCDQGTSTALPLIGRSIRNNWPGPHGEEELAFCESRIKVVARDPDRVKALGSVLTLDNPGSDRLIRWAVAQLDSMHSPSADAELDRFADQLGKLREGPQYERFGVFIDELRHVRAGRPK